MLPEHLNHVLAFWSVGPWEVIVIAIVALVVFGKRLPEVARSAGKAVTTFKKGLHEVEEDIKEAGDSEPPEKTGKSDDESPGPRF